jgi:hypothetical protein
MSISSSNLGRSEQQSVTIFGNNLAVSAMLGMGQTQSESSRWISETSVLAICAKSVAPSHSLSVTAGGSVGSITEAWSVDTGAVTVVKGFNLPTSDQKSIAILSVSGTQLIAKDLSGIPSQPLCVQCHPALAGLSPSL